ncbi:SDR family oxidoreductase [Mesorhizobium sp. M1334]|uniref:SDR family oxidoreductase n=1 Tax=Mesorhizobium sp. M1334 TaxID=2957084 RepID=UPI00333567C2
MGSLCHSGQLDKSGIYRARPPTGEVAPGTAVDHDEDVRIMAPLGRRGSVDEIAWPAVFLASDAASYITGVNLRIDGGYAVK